MTFTNEPCPHPPCSPASGAGCAKAMLVRRKKQWHAKAIAAGGRESPVYMQVSIARAMPGAPGAARSAHQVSFAFPAAQRQLHGPSSPVCTVSGDHHVQCRSRSDRPLSGLLVWVQTSHERTAHVWVENHPSKGAACACPLGQRNFSQGSAPDFSGFDRLVRGPGIRAERADRREAFARRGQARCRRDDCLFAGAAARRRPDGGIASQ